MVRPVDRRIAENAPPATGQTSLRPVEGTQGMRPTRKESSRSRVVTRLWPSPYLRLPLSSARLSLRAHLQHDEAPRSRFGRHFLESPSISALAFNDDAEVIHDMTHTVA
jgi:hypothetical protein